MKKKVLAIMLIAMSIMLISACGKKEKLYEIPDLSQYKTDYVGDSSNVINIVSGQEYPAGYSYDSMSGLVSGTLTSSSSVVWILP